VVGGVLGGLGTWWGGVGRKAHCHIKTWGGRLLLGIEAPSLVFQHNGGVGVVKMPHCHVEMRQGGVVGSGETKQKNTPYRCIFSVQRMRGCVGRVGDVSGELGTYQWG